MDALGTLLIVEDDEIVTRALVRTTRSYFQVLTTASKAAALEALEHHDRVCAAIVDVGLPDGDGLDVVVEMRRRSPAVPVLVLTGSNDPWIINRAQLLGVEYVVKTRFADNVACFLQRALAYRSVLDEERLASVLAVIARDRELSRREQLVLGHAVAGVPRSRLAEVLGVSENTVKTQVRSLLDKVGKRTLADAVWWLRTVIEPPDRSPPKRT